MLVFHSALSSPRSQPYKLARDGRGAPDCRSSSRSPQPLNGKSELKVPAPSVFQCWMTNPHVCSRPGGSTVLLVAFGSKTLD